MTLSERDGKHLWHPLTQHKLQPGSKAITRAKGSLLYDDDGREYIDGIASWYTSVYGHCNDYIIDKVYGQMQQLDQIVFSGFTHEPAVKLSELLTEILPDNQNKIFFSDNGSTAVEVAVKIALQFHFNQGKKKKVLLALENGFHGDTFGAMSVSGLSVYNGPFEDFFITVKRLEVPVGDNNDRVLEQLKSLHAEYDLAGFIYEPLVQGAAAMKMYDARGLDTLIGYCNANDIVTIADEVMTGFGKTGTHFASLQLSNKPDVICLSKALTAGMLPMAITSCSERIYQAFYSDEIAKGLFHGHTYSANPLACAAAIAGIELLKSVEVQQGIKQIIQLNRNFDLRVKDHQRVKSTRQCGVIYALDLNIEIERYGGLRNRMYEFFMARGVYLRPLGNTVYIHPSYTIGMEELTKIYDVIADFLDNFDFEFSGN